MLWPQGWYVYENQSVKLLTYTQSQTLQNQVHNRIETQEISELEYISPWLRSQGSVDAVDTSGAEIYGER
jgi:hypothetical protein